MTYGIHIATPEDLEAVAREMDPADSAEVWAMGRVTPIEALKMSARVSRETFVGTLDGRPVCAFGVGQRTLMDNVGIPWLLGTPAMRARPRVFLEASKRHFGELVQGYERLENWVDARHTRAVKWLKWLGFTVDAAAPFGSGRVPFHRFHMGET